MLRSRVGLPWRLCTLACRPMSSKPSEGPATVSISEALKRGPDQRDITNLDIIEERIRRSQESREFKIGGQTQRWNYRSEVVNKLGLDNDHRNIWATYAVIIIVGFTAFVWVKSNVVLSRQEEMQEREKIRRSMKLLGADRKKIAVVDSD